MTKTTSKPQYRASLRSGYLPTFSEAPLSPALDMPEPVRLANDAAGAAAAAHEAAVLAHRHALQSIQQAERIDADTDTAAVAAGKPLPEGRAADKAREAAALAERRHKAAHDVFVSAMHELTAALVAEGPEWSAQLAEGVAADLKVANTGLTQYRDALERIGAARTVITSLGDFTEDARAPWHGSPLTANSRKSVARREAAFDKAVQTSRARPRDKADAAHLMADLAVIAERQARA